MDLGDLETTIKVIVVGNGRVGKSSMTTRYCKGVYTNTYKKTIGVDFMEKSIELDEFGEAVRLMIWDTAGQEEFDSLTSRYYKGAGAAVLVFSTTDRDSFDALLSWKRKVEDECGNIAMALVQNKIDLMDEAKMTSDEVEAKARELGLRLYRTCVKDNVNVSEVFEYLTTEFLMKGETGGGGAIASIGDFAPDAPPAATPTHRDDEPVSSPDPSTATPPSPGPTPASAGGGAGRGHASPSSSAREPRTPAADRMASPAKRATPRARPATTTNGAFRLEPMKPSKVRTGGKKRRVFCNIL